MATEPTISPAAVELEHDRTVLDSLRRRGQFLIGGLLWAAATGLVVLLPAYVLLVYHYLLATAEQVRYAFGIPRPQHSPDWFLLGTMATVPLIGVILLTLAWRWYRRIWMRRLQQTWPSRRDRKRYSIWRRLQPQASTAEREYRSRYVSALCEQNRWPLPELGYEARVEWILADLEKDIAERALTVGLAVGISRNRFLDLFTIFAAALELQLHVLSRLGKRPSWPAWRLLLQRCGASLFLNTYLNRQDALALNLMIKKAGMGLQVTGDLMENASAHLSDNDIDLDEALNLQHAGLLGMATKSLELGATMALTVGQVGLHALGNLIESIGDELTQGALAAGILYHHGIALAADTLALDQEHRQSPTMNRSVREGIWKMGEIAGSILRDSVRQRRNTFRERRRQIVRTLPKSAYAGIQALFGRKVEAS